MRKKEIFEEQENIILWKNINLEERSDKTYSKTRMFTQNYTGGNAKSKEVQRKTSFTIYRANRGSKVMAFTSMNQNMHKQHMHRTSKTFQLSWT